MAKSKKGLRGKQFSKCCAQCGVEWLPDMSNKKAKRALCIECYTQEVKHRTIEQREWREENLITQVQKKRPYTFKNRKPFWQSIANELRGMKSREEWLPFIQNRMNEILNDKQLMDYINETQIADYGND